MMGEIKSLFGRSDDDNPEEINREIAFLLRELADRAERGEIAAIFTVSYSPALQIDTQWLGHMGTSLTLRGVIARGILEFDEIEMLRRDEI